MGNVGWSAYRCYVYFLCLQKEQAAEILTLEYKTTPKMITTYVQGQTASIWDNSKT